MDIDITQLSPALSMAELQTNIGYAMLENAQELAAVEAEAVTELISSVPGAPGVGENIDISL